MRINPMIPKSSSMLLIPGRRTSKAVAVTCSKIPVVSNRITDGILLRFATMSNRYERMIKLLSIIKKV